MSLVLKPVVLIVEDEHLIRMLAVQAFLDDGFVVLEARHAAEALLVHASAACVQVLFTDVNMPGLMNGLQLAETLKNLDPNLLVIITSARPLPRSLGVREGIFLTKPYDIDEVCRTAKTLLAA